MYFFLQVTFNSINNYITNIYYIKIDDIYRLVITYRYHLFFFLYSKCFLLLFLRFSCFNFCRYRRNLCSTFFNYLLLFFQLIWIFISHLVSPLIHYPLSIFRYIFKLWIYLHSKSIKKAASIKGNF